MRGQPPRSARRRALLYAGAETLTAPLQAGPRILAGLVAALEGLDLRVVDALSLLGRPVGENALAVLDVAVAPRVAGGDVRAEPIEDGLAAALSVCPTLLDARVVTVQARVDRHLEVLTAVRIARPEVLLRGVLALGNPGRVRLLGRATGTGAHPELPSTLLERGAELLARVVAALERYDLCLIDAVIAVDRPRRESVPAVLLGARQRRFTGGERLIDPRGRMAVLPLGPARLHALVVAIEAGVLRDLKVLHATGLAVLEFPARVLGADAAPGCRRAERGDESHHAPEHECGRSDVHVPFPPFFRPVLPEVDGRKSVEAFAAS